MTDQSPHEQNDDGEPDSASAPGADHHSGGSSGPDSGGRWSRDHGSDVPRTASGGLPLGVIITSFVIFALGFYLFRRWRQQYVTYGVDSAGELPAVLGMFGLG